LNVPLWESAFERSRRLPFWVGAVVALLLVAAMAWFRRAMGHDALPIGYGVPIILIGLFHSRRLLWSVAVAFVALTICQLLGIQHHWSDTLMVICDLLLVTAVVDIWIVTTSSLEVRNVQLEGVNADIAAREEEIARQNEELQSQTEELERQSEELRVTNEELAHREKILETLLALSRSLNTEQSTSEIMTRICQTLDVLINGPGAAAAILEQHGDQVSVRCHHGFGEEGIREETIPLEQSFAVLILGKGRTGYIEDIAMRPDLRIPQPKAGEPMVAILATPLRVRGSPVGSLEVYSRHKTTWSQEQVALVESLAAQTSVSLEAAHLFETISNERNRYEAVLRTVPVGIAVCDANCRDIRLNPAAAALLNLPADQNLGNSSDNPLWQAFRNGKSLSREDHPILVAARRGEEVHGDEIEMVMANGKRVVVLTYARPIKAGDGASGGAVAVFVDITAQKELQRELDLRRREAEEASVRKTRFLAAVSHDIRTPANAISLLAELIRRTASNPAMAADVPELAQELHGSAVSLVNLLSDVLDIARFDSNKVEVQESEFPLHALLNDEQKQLLPLAREKGLSLDVNAPPETLVIRTDRIKLARILGNLVGNAIKFTESGGVRIDARRNGDSTLHIAVSDTGIGIAPEHLEHIFDEFFQLRNPERDRAKGSGLGLTICKRLVEAMGGKLEVQSTPGKGSVFTVILPTFAIIPQISSKSKDNADF
jgi:PAS domain S-box-containing protein